MATITETGTIDLAAQKEAHDEASLVATNYITPNGTSTASFHPQASSTNQVKVDGTGVDIIKGNASVAKYGDVARIGKSSESRVEIDYHSLKLIDKNNNIYFHISDLRDSNGIATILTTIVIDDSITRTDTKTRITLALSPDSIESVKLDGTLLNSNKYSLVSNLPVLEILYVLANGQEVTIEYTTSSILAKAFTLGIRNTTSPVGLLSYAEGYSVISNGFASHAEGYQTEASSNDSHAEGSGTSANKTHAHAEGFQTTANGMSSHSEGSYTQANETHSHAEGLYTQANGMSSHAEGSYTQATRQDSHAEGYNTQANGQESHAEGSDTIASGVNSHAEGSSTQANGADSHAEGYTSIASGDESHAEGDNTQAIGDASHSQNLGTIAHGEAQTTIGKYNVENTSGTLAFIIGNGTANNARSNAFKVDWDGNVYPTKKVVLTSPANRDNPSGTAVYDNERSLYIVDADGERIGMIRTEQSTGGNITLTLMSIGEKTDGTEVINQISLNSLRDGTKTYYVADQAAFRSAISAFSTGGGTITGLVAAKNTVIDRKVNPSSAQYSTDVGGGSSFQLVDKNGAVLGYIRASKQTDGRTGLDLRVWNSDTDGNNVVNGNFHILINRSGTVSYSMSNPENLRSAISATGAVAATSNTIPNLLTELRYTIGGRIGSVSITTAYTNGATIPTGWYNYMWIPHRNGGSSGDNGNFGALILCGMTVDAGPFWVRYDNGSIGYVRDISLGSTGKILPRGNGGTGMSARTTGTVTRSGLDTAGTINAYSNGVVCTVSAANVHLKTALANNGSVTLATLPTGYRPPMSVYGNLCSDSATNGKGYVGITSSGEIKFHNYKGSNWATSDDIRFTITWAL